MARIPITPCGTSQRGQDSRRLPKASATWASKTTMSRTPPSGLSMTPCMPIVKKWCDRASPTAISCHKIAYHAINQQVGRGDFVEPQAVTGQAQQMQQAEARERRNRADALLILTMRGLRSFAYGLLAVLLGVALANAGFAPVAIGILITVSLIGDFVGTYVIGLVADHFGRRRTLFVLALLMAGTGAVFGLTNVYALLLLAAFFGTLGTSASETAPFLPIEQAILPETCPPEQRTALFARYNLVASFAVALGALAAGLPDLLTRAGLPEVLGIRLFFGAYAALALLVAGLSLQLSSHVEAPQRVERHIGPLWHRLLPPLGRS